MAAKFTSGDSIATTRKVTPKHRPRDVETHSHGSPKPGNTMSGMPGWIDGHPESRVGETGKGGKGAGPHREGDVGRRGGGHEAHKLVSGGEGTQTSSYRKSSFAQAGGERSNLAKTPHVHTHNVAHGSGGTHKGPPTAHGKIPGGGHSAGMGASIAGGTRHGGKMESLRGKATTSYEHKRGKSLMY